MARAQPKRDKPSWAARFHAWWEGYDLAPAPPPAKPSGPAGAPSIARPAEAAADSGGPWPAPRREVARRVWGDGFVAPGGPARLIELVRPLALDGRASLLEIGAGMGGAACALAAELGPYISAFVGDPDLARAGAREVSRHGLGKKVSVRAMDFAQPALQPRFYDGGLIHDTLMEVPDKPGFLRHIADALKPGTPLAVSDLFAVEGADPAALAEWAGGELDPVHPETAEELVDLLAGLALEIREVTDVSDAHAALIRAHWDAFVRAAERESLTRELAIPLRREVELWVRRAAALQARTLCHVQIIAVRKR